MSTDVLDRPVTRQRPPRRRIVAAAAAVLLVVVVLAIRWANSDPDLRVIPPNGAYSAAFWALPLHSTELYVTGDLCTGAGPLTIASVVARDEVGRLDVVDWGMHNEVPQRVPGEYVAPGQRDGLRSDYQGTISTISGYGRYPVRARCGAKGQYSSLVIKAAASSDFATMSGVEVRSRDGETAFLPYRLTLCSAPKSQCPGLSTS